jgi:sec-independent protein translocase protein TatC
MTSPSPQEPAALSPPSVDIARPLMDHLVEIQRRLYLCLGAVGLLSIVGWNLFHPLLRHFTRRIGPLVFLSPAEAFLSQFKLSVLLGVFLAAPILLYHAWRFVGVALTVGEKRVFLGALPFSYLLFVAGVALGWTVIVPLGLKFLLSFHTAELTPLWSVSSCLEFALWTSGGLGLLFQLPVVLTVLASWGFVRASTLRHYRRHAIVILLIVSGVLTPGPDVLSQLLLATPAYTLYEISIVLVSAVERRRKRRTLDTQAGVL